MSIQQIEMTIQLKNGADVVITTDGDRQAETAIKILSAFVEPHSVDPLAAMRASLTGKKAPQ